MTLTTATGREIECYAHFVPPSGNAHLILALTMAEAAEVFNDPDETAVLTVKDGETELAALADYTQLDVISAVEPGVLDKTRVSIRRP